MHITATHIAEWARSREAQADLPRWIRKLVYLSAKPIQIDFPSGESTNLAGWDGEVMSEVSSSWVPKGKSYWECSCDAEVTRKANKDYNKRTKESSDATRKQAALIIISARRWSRKKKWAETKRKDNAWQEVRAYDADDLEQWLEQTPVVSLQFAEEIGLIGQGVESIEKYWDDWSRQSSPSISAEAMFVDREMTRDRLVTEIQRKLETGQPEIYAIKADSVDEAAAFVCAAIIEHPGLNSVSLVVTESQGWRFVAKNPELKIAVSSRPEIAEKPTRRTGLCTIIPYASGDMAGHYRGTAGRDSVTDLSLERPRISKFEKALVTIGLDEANATRIATSTGRSWSVFRRRHSVNPSIRRPPWLDAPQAGALASLCLLSGWSDDKSADREVVAYLSGRAYEDVEKDLLNLSRLDDAPVLKIGDVWKAKSPLELLDLYGDRITNGEINRFFEIAHQILVQPDPQLDLPDDKRYAAQVYGKVRPQSGLLIQALCDTLIKLSVRGTQVTAFSAADVEGKVSVFVNNLLQDADATRWLSLSSFLPSLAEAAPAAFLKAVDISMSKPDKPISRLITETDNSGLMGRCWHAGLLWALETLAWAPEWLTHVAFVLASLAHVAIKGNWANTPKNSLLNVFRSWFPQTAADIDRRIAIIDELIESESDIAFDLLDSLLNVGHDTAFPSARPRWRDDDAHAGHGVTYDEQNHMLLAVADRLVTCSAGNAQRVARLIKKIDIFDYKRKKKIKALIEQFTESMASDEDKELIRTALREKISWHYNYYEISGKASTEELRSLEDISDRLLPKNLLVRHRWLFNDAWPRPPVRVRDSDFNKRHALIDALRIDSLREIHSEIGMNGVEHLATVCALPYYVGATLAKLDIDMENLVEWLAEKCCNMNSQGPLNITINGLLCTIEADRSGALIRAVVEINKRQGWNVDQTALFLTTARTERETWDIAASCGEKVENAYWSKCSPGFLQYCNEADTDFALRRLLSIGRPRTALQACHIDLNKVDITLLTEMLEHYIIGEESGGPLLDAWYMGEALELIESSGILENERLVRLEFGLFPALGYPNEQKAKFLYNAIMSDPKLFTELIRIAYRREDGERDESVTDVTKAAAEIAWHILHHCHRQPGTQPDGSIDRNTFINFINEARELCRKVGRLNVCDIILGEILAHAPSKSDGVWPFAPACAVLDRPDHERMRHGFHSGVINKRGTTKRAYDEGGAQERKLSEVYHDYAQALKISHPNVSAILEDIARSYENYGKRHDIEADLRREGY